MALRSFGSRLATAATAAVLVLTGMTVSAGPALAAGTTYYLDADAGNDAAAGTSPTSAWRSLSKVNASSFQPGDSIRFQGGDVWHGGLTIKSSGTAAAPLTIGAYGTGRPLIAGDTTVDATVLLDNVHDVQMTDLEVTNSTDLSVSKSTTYRGIFAIAKDLGDVPGIVIKNNYVHHVDGKGGPVIGKGGIAVGVRGNSVPTWYSGLRIESNEVAQINAYGISTFTTWCASCEIYPAETGIPTTEVSSSRKAFTGSLFLNNYVHDVTAGGITPQYVDDALVEGNTVDKAGSQLKVFAGNNAGIWWQGTNRITVQYNVVRRQGYGSFNAPDPVDGMAFDADMGSTNSVVQYNYADSNSGGFFMCLISANNITLRYNVSRRDFYRPFSIWSGCWNLRGYNNTVWGTADTVTRHRSDGTTFQQGIEAFVRDEAASGNALYNNIFYNPGRGTYRFGSDQSMNYSHNLYWDNSGTPLKPTNDPAAITADPQLTNPGQDLPEGKIDRTTLLQTLANYAPTTGSPAGAAGVSAATAPKSDGVANRVPHGRPDLGAVQHPVTNSASTTLGTSAGTIANLTDGDPTTSWATGNNPALPGSASVEWSEARTIDALHLGVAFGQGQGPTLVDVQTKSGGVWTTRVSGRSLAWSQNSSSVEWLEIGLPDAVPADGIRLVIRASNLTWGHTAINELTAVGGKVAASDVGDYTGTSAQNAVDGVPGTSWASSGATLGKGLQIDPGAPQTVSSITLSAAFGQGQGPTTVRVMALNNGVWTQVVNATNLTWSSNTASVESRTVNLPTPATGTTFYLIVDQANLTWGHYALNEVTLN
ncbi:parallel beta helix pectate lyase-like protein [Kribbella voronezhensis]|uniref:Parallel beta helix pectate lyase-like protein n=1 Tax=Kribbella voronezhensis TaxID=2512212 RepID=A0A4R7TA08_9ACTN|nr:discoidin domain-containing protein [Kribbella voronezhensis]TDU88840.1 parallel beta helix pectate lyase-like protein [Kribbella voronezhensis]